MAAILDEATGAALGRVRVVLARTSHPGNIGAAARAMKAMGLSRLVLVAPKVFPDPQAVAMAAGADDVLDHARVVATLAEALAGTRFATAFTARRRELATEPLWLREAAGELAACAAGGEVALVFGNESAGLTNEELAQCPRWAMIPVDAGFSSLNLAAAVQLACYELRLAIVGAGATPAVAGAGEPVPLEDIERLVDHLEQVAVGSGFLDPAVPKRFHARMQRLFHRARLEREELNILRGVLAAVRTKT